MLQTTFSYLNLYCLIPTVQNLPTQQHNHSLKNVRISFAYRAAIYFESFFIKSFTSKAASIRRFSKKVVDKRYKNLGCISRGSHLFLLNYSQCEVATTWHRNKGPAHFHFCKGHYKVVAATKILQVYVHWIRITFSFSFASLNQRMFRITLGIWTLANKINSMHHWTCTHTKHQNNLFLIRKYIQRQKNLCIKSTKLNIKN